MRYFSELTGGGAWRNIRLKANVHCIKINEVDWAATTKGYRPEQPELNHIAISGLAMRNCEEQRATMKLRTGARRGAHRAPNNLLYNKTKIVLEDS